MCNPWTIDYGLMENKKSVNSEKDKNGVLDKVDVLPAIESSVGFIADRVFRFFGRINYGP